MMFPSHLLATILVALVISRLIRLTPGHWTLAILFGVVIDVDHALNFPRYVMAHGGILQADFSVATMSAWGSNWQGFMHTTWAVPVVIAACLLAKHAVPAVFWGLHMVQDFVIARHFVTFGGSVEWIIIGALAASIVGTLALHHRVDRVGSPFRSYVKHRVTGGTRAMAAAIAPAAALSPLMTVFTKKD